MRPRRLGGAAPLVIGVVPFVLGVNAPHAVADRWGDFSRGHFTGPPCGIRPPASWRRSLDFRCWRSAAAESARKQVGAGTPSAPRRVES